MPLELTSLRKAVASLERAASVAEHLASMPADQGEVVKAGVIQNFEFTYELCWKFMKRWLAANIGAPHVDGVTRRELFRRSAENGLIDEVERWMEFHHARNQTSHAYDVESANEIFEVAKVFLPEAKHLLATLEGKND
jgi:nucleotidyltransferase substrate binding protein (TIGR01987 family)